MSKYAIITLAILGIMFAGCEKKLKDGAIYQLDPQKEKLATEVGFAVPDPTEVDLVEYMARHRAGYREGLKKLYDYYTQVGYASQRQWAKRELESLDLHYKYLMPAEMAPAELVAADKIAAADELYEQGMELFEDAGGLMVITDEEKLKSSLRMFNEIITEYPTSDKIDDAAFRAGQIFEYFDDYEVAAVYYQRAYQWDDMTDYPARYRAARMMDKLRLRKEALTLYRLVLEKESRYKSNAAYAQRRIDQLVKIEDKPEL